MRYDDDGLVKRTPLLLAGALAFGLVAALPAPGAAQEGVDARWLPLVGCWESAEAESEALLCVRGAEEETGVEMLTVVDGEVVSRHAFRADGVPVESEREGCTGVEEATFSRDGHRVFLTSEHVCDGGLHRSSTGIMTLVDPTWLVDVEVVEVEGESAAWVRHYRMATDRRAEAAGFPGLAAGSRLAASTARLAAARAPDVDDVIEASRHVAPEAVRTWVVQLDERFDLDAEELIRMDDAGVPGEVIDVVVAVTYPEEFDVGQRGEPTEEADRYAEAYRPYRGGGYYGGSAYFGYDPFYYSGFYPRSRFGHFGHVGGFGRFGPTVVVVDRRGGGGVLGRVINGRGYSSGRGSASDGSDRSSRGSSVRRGSGSTRSSGAAKAGSSKSESKRKAKRRGGGGGGLD